MISDFQQEVTAWADRNFGHDPAHRWYPLAGAIEEIGELAATVPFVLIKEVSPVEACLNQVLQAQALLGALAHAVLKSAQGIRGHSTSDCVRLSYVCAEIVFSLQRALARVGISCPDGEADLGQHQADREDAIGDVIVYLADLCRRNGMDLDEAVTRTWDQVKQRDWLNNPATGGSGEA